MGLTRISRPSAIEGAAIGAAAASVPTRACDRGLTLGRPPGLQLCGNQKSVLGPGSKANHLAYIGDAEIGADSNVGAGTITCNYDGVDKHPTRIGDGVFVGSNSTLVATVTLSDHSFVAAGSVVTEDVPEDQLAPGRARQRNVSG